MKNLTTILGVIIFASVIFTSCKEGAKKDESVKIKPKTTIIKGDLGDYFEVVDKEYEIKKNEGEIFTLITVEVKRNNKDFTFPTTNINPFGTNGGEDYHVGFGIELLGESGPITVVPATADGMGGPYDSEDVTGLMSLKKGETGYIRWSVKNLDGLKSFQLSSALQKEEHSASSDDSGDDSGDCDQFCSDYEAFADEYVALMKKYKANTSDASILSEYTEMMSKASEMQESSKDCAADTKAAARISKAIARIAKAAM
jgi:hypothetical protein